MNAPARIGLVGCGSIARQYLVRLDTLSNLELAAACDVVPEAAQRVADEYGVPAVDLDTMLSSDDIDVVLNLTIPSQHVPISSAVLESGKHVYQEKPFGVGLPQARELYAVAERTGLRIGTAPDTVLGTGIQTARAALDAGRIGTPVAATAFMMSPGHEGWHPNPAFYYLAGGGPLMDMGVYYLTTLVTLLGPVESVTGMGSHIRTVRVAPDGAPRAGEELPVEVDTHVTALVRHISGAITTLVVSFDVAASRLPLIEVYGTGGTLAVPDPNQFEGAVELATERGGPWATLEPSAGYLDAGRGHGLSDMVRAIATDTPHRQSAELGLHVHEVMEAVLASIDTGSPVSITSGCNRPDPVPYGADPALA